MLAASLLPLAFCLAPCAEGGGPAPPETTRCPAAGTSDGAAACLDRITVTARRREEPLAQVPLSVAVLEGDAAEGHGLHAIASRLPGLSLSETGLVPGHDLSVRGISTAGGFAEVRPLTATYLGDTPLGYPVTLAGIAMYDPVVEPIDLDRIELLRGPQGTHFGAHAMGGALRLLPNPPDPRGRYGWFGLSLLGVAHGEAAPGVRAMLNVPWRSGGGALRTVAFARGVPGWIDDPGRTRRDVNGQRHLGTRSAASWHPTDAWRIEAGLAAQQRDGDAPWIHELDQSEHVQTRDIDERETDAWWLAWLDAERAGEGWRLRLHQARFERAFDLDGDVSDYARRFGLTPPLTVQNRNRQHDWTHELRLHSERAEARWDWLIGVFLQDRTYRGAQEFPGPNMIARGEADDVGGGSTFSLRTRTELQQQALYGEASWRPTPAWELSAGGRVFRLRDRAHTRATGVLGNSDVPFGDAESGSVPRLGLRRTIGDGHIWYASAAQGFRPGGSNDPTGTDVPACGNELAERGLRFAPRYRRDRLWSYEVGMRMETGDGRLRLDTAAFHIDWDAVQTDIVLRCTGLVFVVNGSGARSRGGELQVAWRPRHDWSLLAAASYARARYTADLPGLGVGRGMALPGAPRLQYQLALEHRLDRYGVDLSIEHTYVGGFDTDPFATMPLRVPSHRLTHFALAGGRGPWHFEVGVRNVFDSRVVTGGQNDFLGSFESVGLPRHLVLTLIRDIPGP